MSNVLTDYYCFKKIALKSKMRLDCISSTESYPDLEEKRATKATKGSPTRDPINVGDLICYLGDVPENFGGDIHRKADKSITVKGRNLSSIYVPDPENGFAYGDFRGTNDALLFVFDSLNIVDGRIQAGGCVHTYIARGMSKDRVPLYNLLADGVLDEEMDTLRKQAVTKSVTKPEG